MSWQKGKREPAPWAAERDREWESIKQQRDNSLYGDSSGYRKPLTGSKTIWSGLAVMLMSIFSYFQGLDAIQSIPWLVCLFGVGIGVLMIILRFVTGAPVYPPNVLIRKMVGKKQ